MCRLVDDLMEFIGSLTMTPCISVSRLGHWVVQASKDVYVFDATYAHDASHLFLGARHGLPGE